MEIILEGIGFRTLIEIFENYYNNITGLYLDKESDLYNLYLKDVKDVKIYDDYILILFNSYRPYKKIRSDEIMRVVIQ